MSERPKDDADPDATVMLPSGGMRPGAPDDDATVMIPAARLDDDATVMIPPARQDDDATVMIPAPSIDPDATVMIAAAAADEPDPEATIAIPTPGRRRDADAPTLPSAPAAGSLAEKVDIGELGGLNPLIAAANPVLAVAAQIRHALKHSDPAGLRASLRQSIGTFERAALAAGYNDDTVAAASIALGALVDESGASTPWGSTWADGGPDKFFPLLEKHSADPAVNRELLEFFYVCLALGFEGRFRQAPDGRQALAELRSKLLGQLRTQRPVRDGELSGLWRGVSAPARRPAGVVGLWTTASCVALVLAAIYVAFSVSLGGLSDPVARELAQLKAAQEPEKPSVSRGPAATPHIAEQLATEIARGEVAVVDAEGMSTIVIRSDRLFASGSARLEPGIEPVVLRVAESLDQVTGMIAVTGHTDDVPIRTARFPSNWELSTERASSVVKLMAGKLKDPSRLRAEGLADSVPAASNDSVANRARNRRVEINLRSSQ